MGSISRRQQNADTGGGRGLLPFFPFPLPPLQRLGRPVGSVFDLVVGTSTGAILAVSLGVLKYSLDMCEGIYTKLGHKVRGGLKSRWRLVAP